MRFNFKPLPKNLRGQRVLLRVDFNMPIKGREIGGDIRVSKTMTTINFLRRLGAKVILMSHLEKDDRCPSMRVIFNKVRHKIPGLRFASGLVGPKIEKTVKSLKPGGVLMLENLRLDSGEKKNSPIFAKRLATLADIYVNEAFSVSHRLHTSIVGLPKYLPSYAGLLFRKELENLSLAFNPPKPFIVVIGGDKLSTKIPLIKKFLKKADYVVVGGALVSPFLFGREKKIKNPKMFLPKDVVIERRGRRIALDVSRLGKHDVIYDLGPKSMKAISDLAAKSRFILWNGPLGFIEKGFVSGTVSLIKALRSSRARVVAGGGDTAAFLYSRRLTRGFHFISTAGGAMLEFLVRGTLPGIEALKK